MPKRSELLVEHGTIWHGTLLVILSAILFAAGGVFTKYLSDAISPTAVLLWRNFVSAALVLLWFLIAGLPPLRTPKVHIHLVRGSLTFVGLWTYFLAISMIPLSTAVLLRSAAPIFVPLLAYLAYRRWSDQSVWIGSFLGFLGVIIVVQPVALNLAVGTTIGLFSGFLGGAAAVAMWRLGTTERGSTQTAWLVITMTLWSAAMSPWALEMPRASDWPAIILVALTTTASQFILAHAFTVAPADKIIAWGYLSVVFGALIGYLVWDEPIAPATIFGIVLIVIGSQYAARQKK